MTALAVSEAEGERYVRLAGTGVAEQQAGATSTLLATSTSPVVDIEALAVHYQNEDFWRRSMTKASDDGLNEAN